MNRFRIISVIGLGLSLSAGFAAADGVRLPVGDLGDRAAAVDFNHRLEAAADQFCYRRYRLFELTAIAACESAVREEALDQLSPTQRQALAAALRPASLASR